MASIGFRYQRQIMELREVLSLSPFDPSTPEGRSKERYRRVVLTAISSLSARGVTALTMLISVPLTVSYLGAERYGMWMAISSLIAMLSFADMGIGNGLVNSIADANGRDDREEAIGYVSSAFFMLLGVALTLLLGFSILYRLVSWPTLFGVVSARAAGEVGPAVAMLVLCFLINIPLGVVERVRMGYQEGFANSIWQSLGNLGGLGFVLLAIRLEAGLPWLVLAMAGTPVVAMICNAVEQFGRRRPWLRPRLDRTDRETALKLFNVGALFFVLQILTAVGLASDNMIIARIHGLPKVAGYSVVQKLYSLALLPQFLVAPLWPAFSEALARREYGWARQALHRGVWISIGLAALIALPLLVFGQWIVAFWAGAGLRPSRMLLAGFTCQVILGAYGGAMTSFLNSSQSLKRQVTFYGLASITAILLKIVLASRWQIAGVAWATVIAYGLIYAIPAWGLANRVLRGE